MLHGFHAAAAVACSRVQRNSVPSTHMRCMITANRRARATIAFFIPRRLAICIAQALSQDHFVERSIEQFNRADPDHEHCERYGVVVKPIPLGLHDTPPWAAS